MINTILFDLDGTIVDTNELIIQSFLHVLDGVVTPPMTREGIVPHMGFPLKEQLRFFSGLEDVDELMAKYRSFNLAEHDRLVREFSGVRETLQLLHERGVRMGVVTNKMRRTTMMGLQLCGLERFMDVIVTVDDVERGKPYPDSVLKALEQLHVEPQHALMVGDSQYDIQAAQAAGVAAVGVAWSLKGADYLQTFRPDYMIDEMKQLLELVS